MRKNLKLKKAQKELQRRIKGYEEACKNRSDDGRGFRRPGSLRVKK